MKISNHFNSEKASGFFNFNSFQESNVQLLLQVDSVFSGLSHNGPSKLVVFFDTAGSWGKERIQFSFFMLKPAALSTLKTLIYNISAYKQRRCSEVFKIIGYEGTPVDSFRNLVVDPNGPLKRFYMVSYIHEFTPKLEPRYKYIGSYDGDMELLAGVIFNNVIVNMGFLCNMDLCKKVDLVENYDD